VILWKGLPTYNAYAIILLGMVFWLIISMLLWALRRKRIFRSRKSDTSGQTSAAG
jgi:hypothetical protein